ncbi:MAG TPA: EAL domain-containing protein [Gammaproteobacteria bacterium]
MDKEKTLRLIIAEESRNDAEALANILRNAGYAVRHVPVCDQEELEAALAAQAPDLILCALELETLPLDDVFTHLAQLRLEVPVIAVGASATESEITGVLRQGAADLATYDQPERLQLIIARELKNQQLCANARRFESSFRESEKRARSLMESSRDAITYIHEGMHIYANRSYLEMFGFDELDEIEGTPILDMVSQEDHAMFKDFLRNYGKEEQVQEELDLRGLLPDGSTFKACMEFSSATIEGEPCTQIIIRNQSNSQELEQKLKYLSKQDILTGLYNRQYFMEEMELAVTDARSGSGNSGLFYLLLDNFRDIKENVGIGKADLVLREIADLLREQCEAEDVLARFGDHSFTLIRKNIGGDEALAFAEQLRKAIEEHIAEVEDQSVTTSCSIGLSLITESAPTAQQLLAQADLACELARSSGGNRVHLHNPVADEQRGREREQQWNEIIQQAIKDGAFQLVYQPIVSLTGNHQEKYEVFVRMLGEAGQAILPGQFLASAEQSGQIIAIDQWVIRRAVEVLAKRRKDGIETQFFVKLSGQTLGDPELAIWINDLLRSHSLAASSLVFEIAEQTAQQYLKNAKAFIKAMQQIRCQTALEHFGSGPNSFQLLKHLPVDYLKIDGSFIHNLASEPDNQAVVKSIVEMAQSMNKQCIAEFVQDAHSLAVLWQSGVHYIQGYFLQEPDTSLSYDFSDEVA